MFDRDNVTAIEERIHGRWLPGPPVLLLFEVQPPEAAAKNNTAIRGEGHFEPP
jgi:hypothetical protein